MISLLQSMWLTGRGIHLQVYYTCRTRGLHTTKPLKKVVASTCPRPKSPDSLGAPMILSSSLNIAIRLSQEMGDERQSQVDSNNTRALVLLPSTATPMLIHLYHRRPCGVSLLFHNPMHRRISPLDRNYSRSRFAAVLLLTPVDRLCAPGGRT